MTKPISPLLPIAYSKEVASAKQRGAPIVALESTIITHGMPYPGNIEMARSVEALIREQGAVPATIAVIHGTLHIGLESDQLEQLAQAKDVLKVSRADLAFAIAERRHGATTVAATMIEYFRAPRSSRTLTNWATVERFWPTATYTQNSFSPSGPDS